MLLFLILFDFDKYLPKQAYNALFKITHRLVLSKFESSILYSLSFSSFPR